MYIWSLFMPNSVYDRLYRDITGKHPLMLNFSFSFSRFRSALHMRCFDENYSICVYCRCGDVLCASLSQCGLWCMWHFIHASINAQMNRHIAHHCKRIISPAKCVSRKLNVSTNWIYISKWLFCYWNIRINFDSILSQYSASPSSFCFISLFFLLLPQSLLNSTENHSCSNSFFFCWH